MFKETFVVLGCDLNGLYGNNPPEDDFIAKNVETLDMAREIKATHEKHDYAVWIIGTVTQKLYI